MTQDEVDKMIAEVENGSTIIEEKLEKSWLENELKDNLIVEQKALLAFRTHKHLRDDASMKQSYQVLTRTRIIIKYLKKELEKFEEKTNLTEEDGNSTI